MIPVIPWHNPNINAAPPPLWSLLKEKLKCCHSDAIIHSGVRCPGLMSAVYDTHPHCVGGITNGDRHSPTLTFSSATSSHIRVMWEVASKNRKKVRSFTWVIYLISTSRSSVLALTYVQTCCVKALEGTMCWPNESPKRLSRRLHNKSPAKHLSLKALFCTM